MGRRMLPRKSGTNGMYGKYNRDGDVLEVLERNHGRIAPEAETRWNNMKLVAMVGGVMFLLCAFMLIAQALKGYQTYDPRIINRGPNDYPIEMYRDGMVDGCAGWENKPGNPGYRPEYGYGVTGILYDEVRYGRERRDNMRKEQRKSTKAFRQPDAYRPG